MKKILLTCMMMLIGLSSYAQITVNEGFEGTSTPAGFVYTSISRTTVTPRFCNGAAALTKNFYSSAKTGNIVYSSAASNATAMNVSFNYKALEYSTGSGVGGTFKAEYSVNGGTTYTQLGSDIVVSAVTPCTSFTDVIPAGTIPTAASFKFRISGTQTSGDYWFIIDDVMLQQVITCPMPSAVVISALSTATATLSWTAATTAPANGYDVYYSTSSTAPTAATVANFTGISGTSQALTGLTSGTTYYAYVRSNCSAADQSNWAASGAFTTNCVAFATPYTENFDTTPIGSSTATNAPNCWTYLETAASAGYGYVRASLPQSSPNSYYLYNAGDITGNILLVSPQTTNLTDGTKRVKFYARGSAGYTVEIGTVSNNADASTFSLISSVAITAAYEQYTVNIPVGTNSYLAFKHGLGGTFRGISLDDVLVENLPSCVEPGTPMISGATTSSLTATWTVPPTVPGVGYDVYYSTTNTAPTAATVLDGTNSVTSTTTSATIPGLPASTTYYVWVRSNCSAADQSIWVSAGSGFTGYCIASTTSQATWISSFTSTGAPTNMAYTAAAGVAPGYQDLTATNKIANIAGSTTNIDITVGGPTAGVAIWVDWNNNLVFEASEKANIATGYLTTTSGATITVPNGTAMGNYRMRAVVNYNSTTNPDPCVVVGRGDYVDYTFEVLAPPSCAAPFALTSPNITTTTADISWTAPASAPANGYDVYYSTTNTAPTAATVLDGTNSVSSTTTSATILGLMSSTPYYVWVRSKCSAADKSTWAGPLTVTTVCTATTVPYTENFETATVGGTANCTSLENAGTGNNWAVINNNGYGFTSKALVYTYNSANAANAWFFTNGLNLAAGAYTISYDYGSTSFDEKLKVAYGTSPTSAAMTNTIATYDPVTPKSVANTASIDVTITTAGTYYFGFNAFSDADQFYLAVDNISVVAKTLGTTNIVKEENGVNIYPNPFSDFIRISDVKDVVSVSIVDMAGRIVKTVKPANEINLSSLRSGMYLINLTMKDGSVKTVKAIKK